MSQDERARYFADLYKRYGVAFNPDSAICKYWIEQAGAGRWLGPPMESEHQTENGKYTYQSFANAVITYDHASGQVTEGLPPVS